MRLSERVRRSVASVFGQSPSSRSAKLLALTAFVLEVCVVSVAVVPSVASMVSFHGHPTRIAVAATRRRVGRSHLTALDCQSERLSTSDGTDAATASTADSTQRSPNRLPRVDHHVNTFTDKPPPDPRTMLRDDQIVEYGRSLLEWLRDKSSVLCITGAGLSTESGIPDYRGHNGSYHKGHRPVLHREFMESEQRRKMYWGRSIAGWQGFHRVQPNRGHHALTKLEQIGKLGVAFEDDARYYRDPDDFLFSSGQQSVSIVTQNVDSLHQLSGTRHVIPLHGIGKQLRCMNCGTKSDRNEYQQMLRELNRDWLMYVEDVHAREREQMLREGGPELRPDGDAQLSANVSFDHVCVPNCSFCKVGIVKPDVVFFGDSVPKHRSAKFQQAVQAADGVLVVGTSLAVHSAYRHARAAYQANVPIAIVNVGPTRLEVEAGSSDGLLKLEGPAGDILSHVADGLKG